MYLIWNWKSTSVYICTCILSVDECGTSSIFQNRKLLADAYQAQHVMRDLKQKYWYCMLLCTYHFKRFIIELNMSQSSQIESMADKPLTMPWSLKNWDNDQELRDSGKKSKINKGWSMSGSWWPDNLFSTEGTVIHGAFSFNELHLPTVIHGAFSFSELHLPIRKGYK